MTESQTNQPLPRRTRWAQAIAIVALAVQGCATQHRHDGAQGVVEALGARGAVVASAPGEPLVLPDRPLGVADIVLVALSNSPDVQREYIELALGADEVYAAPPWPMPVLSGEWLDPKFPGTTQRVFGIAVAVGDLITWPARRRLSRQHYAALQARVGGAILDAAGETAVAFYHYAAALQTQVLQRQITRTALLRAELAERFRQAGNIEPRDYAELRAAASQSRLDELASADAVDEARAALAAAIGVSMRENWRIDSRLALPEKDIGQVEGLVAIAHNTRLDLESARIEFDSAVTESQAIPWLSWFGNVEIGYVRDKDVDQTVKRGPTVAIGVPSAGHHGAPGLDEAELEFLQLYNDVDNAVTLAASRVNRGRERVELYINEFLPRQGAVTGSTLAEYNFMLTGAFDLLSQKQEQLEGYAGYIEALRDYWLARVELDRALGVAPARKSGEVSWFDIAQAIGLPGAGDEMESTRHEGMDMSDFEPGAPHEHEGRR